MKNWEIYLKILIKTKKKRNKFNKSDFLKPPQQLCSSNEHIVLNLDLHYMVQSLDRSQYIVAIYLMIPAKEQIIIKQQRNCLNTKNLEFNCNYKDKTNCNDHEKECKGKQ